MTNKSEQENSIPLVLQVPVSEELHNGLNDELKTIDNTFEPTSQPNYDAVDNNSMGKLVDTVQGLSPAEVKAYGIDVNSDVYIDKPARQRQAAQQSLQEGYTTMEAGTGRDTESLGSIRKSHVNKKKTKKL